MSDPQDSSELDPTECLAFIEFESHDGESNLEIPLYPDKEITVGRDNKCNYVILDDRVSKRHFRLYPIIYENKKRASFPPLVYCEDLESYNGTYINGVLIGKISHERVGHLLCDSDLIEIRPCWKFRFHQTDHQLLQRDQTQWKDLQYFRDRYHISDRKLGGGNYGDVFLARQIATGKQVACKIVDLNLAIKRLSQPQLADTASEGWESKVRFAEEEKRRVLREIRILAKLSHPNIIDLKKAFCSQDALYIFTELASGGDLFSYMQSHGGYLDDYSTRVITRQVALAVQFIHSKGIAHRDVKAENVLVTSTHFGGRVMLTDFGFAVHANTMTGRMMSKLGTPGYVAPEVDKVDESYVGYTKAVDLWSLGVLTACMFTGDTIIPRQELVELSHAEIASRYLGVDDSYATARWREIPPRALRFIRRLLIINPEKRMTADEALDDSWYTKPPREARALNEAIERINRFWRVRDSEEDILEGLPGILLNATSVPDPHASKTRRKLPDASSSRYFNLDRHLQQRLPSTRKRLLEDLTQSGTQFVAFKEPQVESTLANIRTQLRVPSVISVEGNNIFGIAAKKSTLEPIPDVDQVALIPGIPIAQIEEELGFNMSNPFNPISSPIVPADVIDS